RTGADSTRPTSLGTLACGALVLLGTACGGDDGPTDPDPDPEPTTGTIEVSVETTGELLDPDGYVVTLDGGEELALAANDSGSFEDVDEGDHEVALSEMASNCAVSGASSRTVSVSAGATTTVAFEVVCEPTGAVEISTTTGGDTLDADGYTVTLDGGEELAAAPNGTVTFENVAPGDHEVVIGGVQANCTVDAGASRIVTVADETVAVDYAISCEPAVIDRVVFSSLRDGDLEIYSVRTDGSGLTRHTMNTDANDEADVSPDGTRLTFRATFDVAVKTIGESGYTVLAGPSGSAFSPEWSPDGSRIAFSNNLGDGGEIFVMAPDGSDLVQLTDNTATERDPAWSPDGSRIAFESTRSGASEIWVMDADGSNPTRITGLTGTEGLEAVEPAWSPDGSRIAFESDAEDNVQSVAADGSDLQVHVATDARNPDWSPDGSRIVFSSFRDGNTEVYSANLDGSDIVRLTNDPESDDDPVYTP
ncbi:MAG: hypothetical protein ACODAA_07460, partial [Gemmatimonadota bacterium]